MNLTERAELILGIAHRINAEKAQGWPVDPSRLEWAEDTIRGNRDHSPARATGTVPAEQRTRAPVLQEAS